MSTPKFNELFDRLLAEKEIEAIKFNPNKDYYLKSYDEIPSGTLSDDVRVIYDRLSGMSGEVHSGEEFVKQLVKSGLRSRDVNKLLGLEVMEPAQEDETEKELDFEVSDEDELNFGGDYVEDEDDFYGESVETIEEAKKSYSAKKARAGKDIGKKGKMFKKIAKSAGKKYGSKEAGQKVAGAVLKKLRKK